MKKLLFLILLFTVSFGLSAQNMRTLFVEMPDSLLPLLSKINREDCVDFLDANMRARVTNVLGEESELLAFTDNYLHLKTSKSGVMQVKLLLCESDTVLCVVNTVSAEASSSRIAFYTPQWQQLNSDKYFTAPRISDFIVEGDSADYYRSMADIYLVEFSLSATSDSLKAGYTMPSYMLQEDSAKIVPHLKNLYYRWNGTRFE